LHGQGFPRFFLVISTASLHSQNASQRDTTERNEKLGDTVAVNKAKISWHRCGGRAPAAQQHQPLPALTHLSGRDACSSILVYSWMMMPLMTCGMRSSL
jgi:hypothetical protein